LIAMTGYGQEADLQRSQAAGLDHHLVKPADFNRVQRILAGVVPVRRLRERPQEPGHVRQRTD
jgi:CheY-like chemotaxis protein